MPCPRTQQQHLPGQAECNDCSVGFMAQEGGLQTACPVGFRCASGCAAFECPVGMFQNETQATTCEPCPADMYQNKSAQATCLPCSTGYYRVTAVEQAPCEIGHSCTQCRQTPCEPGSFQDEVAQSACKVARRCGLGLYVASRATAIRDVTCSQCPPRTFQAVSNHDLPTCSPSRRCPPGSFVAQVCQQGDLEVAVRSE